MTTEHGSDFLHDPRFQRAYAAGRATGSWWNHDLPWRAYVVCWAAQRGASLEGDYVECGVHRGGYARMLAEYVGLAGQPDRNLVLIDTYAGVPREYGGERFGSVYTECHDDVVRTFSGFPNAVVIRGVIPAVLDRLPPRKVCFLSIDLNCVEPSIAAARHFWPQLSRGAVAVLDDYGFAVFRDQKVAFDAFAATIGVPILSLPTGQGLLIKP